MLRYVLAILLLTVLGVAVVELRWAQNASEARMVRIDSERLKVRRTLWAQQLQLNAPDLPGLDGGRETGWALELAAPDAEPRRVVLARNR